MKYAIPEDLSIPDWLLVPEDRKPCTGPVTDQRTGQLTDELRQRLETDRANRRADERAKATRRLDALNAKHPNERYDSKLKCWVPRIPTGSTGTN